MNFDDLGRQITDKAGAWGADMAGTVGLEDLKRSPSHEISGKMPEFDGVGTGGGGAGKRGVVRWPENARSAVVIAVAHPVERPEMDWWETTGASAGNTAGNRLMMETVSRLAGWLESAHGVQCFKLPYHIERGGVYMKDAAVLAGLGCIGKNNLFIAPRYGPRIRLRVMLTDADLPSAGTADFDPCRDCPMPCRKACPQAAFAGRSCTGEKYGMAELPGRDGFYSRFRCNRQMVMDESPSDDGKTDHPAGTKRQIKYCRKCEMACPVGATSRMEQTGA